MAATMHQRDSFMRATSPNAAFPTPIFMTPMPPTLAPSVSSAYSISQTFPVLAATAAKEFTSYPPRLSSSDPNRLLHTYGVFNEEPIAELAGSCRTDSWSLCVEVGVPHGAGIENPTLVGLEYMVRYATMGDGGDATIQTDVLLTSTSGSGGMVGGTVSRRTALPVYKEDNRMAPWMVNHDLALRLSTNLVVKGSNGGSDQWGFYVDNKQLSPNVRVVNPSTKVFLVFRVNEYPTARTVRSLSIRVSATWQKEDVKKLARAEIERKAAAKVEAKAGEDAERRAKREEERAERAEARKACKEEREAREEARQARDEKQRRHEEKKGLLQQQLRQLELQVQQLQLQQQQQNVISVANAPDVADAATQAVIADTIAELGLEKCPQGYTYRKKSFGYICDGGNHKVTWDELRGVQK